MNTTATYSQNGLTVTFRKSLRNELRYRAIRDGLEPDKRIGVYDQWDNFAYIAGFVEAVDGIDWTPPQLGDNAKKIEASYQTFLDAMPSALVVVALIDHITDLFEPLADEVQRPAETLTAEEKADPN